MRKIWPSEANCSSQTTSEDVCPEDERLNFRFLGVKEARITLNDQYMVSSNLCMPYWIRDQEGRLVRIENPQDTELDICVNIMDPPPEDQNSQQGQGVVIRPHIVPLLPNFHGMESENPYAHIKEFEEVYGGHQCLPHHGFDTWLLVSYFYDGMSSSMKQILETMCGGDFMSKNPEEAMDFLSYVSEVSRGWDEPNSRRKGSFPLNQPKIQKVEYECPTMPAVREMLGDQANVVGQFRPNNNAPYGNTYNSSWRNHPNFSWKPRPPPYQPQAQTQAPQQTSSVEQAIVNLSKVMGDFVGEQKAINSQLHQKIENVESSQIKRMEGMQNDLSQKIDNIQYSISRLTNLNTVNEKGKFPSQPSQNPKGVHEVETQEGESSKLREVKAVITLRSGKEVDQPLPKVRQDEELMSKKTLVKERITKKRRVGRKVHPNQALKKSQG
ncbi:hypothetical protein CK203_063601 [Vitis vinifera]|uniref:Retrotransposon gag domain-containing protein n=2 Tax=Vitis vinifera TaxID=29760 RepID=A0A438G355_VITVI|nr:hypothetical protein CK203_063601 [Vitis vinifera]